LLLGLSIVSCALLLWRAASPRKAVSSAFVLDGGISGLLGGVFSASGPPLVYLMYRQPLAHAHVQESLILFFGIGALLRLAHPLNGPSVAARHRRKDAARPVCGARLPQASGVTLTKSCRRNNSSGDHFTRHFELIDLT
jgi:hypothetical protein